jgi:hypothetical protein
LENIFIKPIIMKKISLIAFLIVVTVAGVIIGCQKTAINKKDNETTALSKTMRSAEIADDEGGTKCNCTAPQTSSCSSDCKFSSCCVCWNPKTHEGGCGCTGGFASCRTEKISLKASAGPEPVRNIVVHTKAFEQFLTELESKGVNVAKIKKLYNGLLENNGRKMAKSADYFITKPAEYDAFVAAYASFIEDQPASIKSEIYKISK